MRVHYPYRFASAVFLAVGFTVQGFRSTTHGRRIVAAPYHSEKPTRGSRTEVIFASSRIWVGHGYAKSTLNPLTVLSSVSSEWGNDDADDVDDAARTSMLTLENFDAKVQYWEQTLEMCDDLDEIEQIVEYLLAEATTYMSKTDDLSRRYYRAILLLLKPNGKKRDIPATNLVPRIASVGYGIKDSILQSETDLQPLAERINELFMWYDVYLGRDTRLKYLAPYFPIVQSSGMGKTKLLFEFKKQYRETATSILIQCVNIDPSPDELEKDVFDFYLKPPRGSAGDILRQPLVDRMNGILENVRPGKVVLMFDEAQHLLENDGYHFRVLRWWLRNEIPETHEVVAVFAGTSSSLSNFYREPLEATTSRNPKSTHVVGKALLYEPFYKLCTIGCLANDADKTLATTEYERAIYHGRPLFAALQKNNSLTPEKHYSILIRMLLGKSAGLSWENEMSSVCSILATRVQMGQVAVPVVSELVSKGYAGLTLLNGDEGDFKVATMCHFPDPVLARLAMCLMDENVMVGKLKGKAKRWWCEKAKDQFSSGFCRPSQGDTGEVFVALYMLFCGDLLRAQYNTKSEKYVRFSVPLSDWLATMLSGGTLPATTGNEESRTRQQGEPEPTVLPLNGNKVTRVPNDEVEEQRNPQASVNFIQVCRNYLRFESKDLFDEYVLKRMYESGTACYTHPNRPTSDIFAPIRYIDDNGVIHFKPLVVQIKTASENLGPTEVEKILDQMTRDLHDAGYRTGLCLLVRLGDVSELQSLSMKLQDSDFGLMGEQIVAKLLIVPLDDAFGITTSFTSVTSDREEVSELYASHPTIFSHVERPDWKSVNSTKAVRTAKYRSLRDPALSFFHRIIDTWMNRKR